MGENIRQIDFEFTPASSDEQIMSGRDILYYRTHEQCRFDGQWIHQQNAEQSVPGYYRNPTNPDIISYSTNSWEDSMKQPRKQQQSNRKRVAISQSTKYGGKQSTGGKKKFKKKDVNQNIVEDHETYEILTVNDRYLETWSKDKLAHMKKHFPSAPLKDASAILGHLWCRMLSTSFVVDGNGKRVRLMVKPSDETQHRRMVAERIKRLERRIARVKKIIQSRKEAQEDESEEEPTSGNKDKPLPEA